MGMPQLLMKIHEQQVPPTVHFEKWNFVKSKKEAYLSFEMKVHIDMHTQKYSFVHYPKNSGTFIAMVPMCNNYIPSASSNLYAS